MHLPRKQCPDGFADAVQVPGNSRRWRAGTAARDWNNQLVQTSGPASPTPPLPLTVLVTPLDGPGWLIWGAPCRPAHRMSELNACDANHNTTVYFAMATSTPKGCSTAPTHNVSIGGKLEFHWPCWPDHLLDVENFGEIMLQPGRSWHRRQRDPSDLCGVLGTRGALQRRKARPIRSGGEGQSRDEGRGSLHLCARATRPVGRARGDHRVGRLPLPGYALGHRFKGECKSVDRVSSHDRPIRPGNP